MTTFYHHLPEMSTLGIAWFSPAAVYTTTEENQVEKYPFSVGKPIQEKGRERYRSNSLTEIGEPRKNGAEESHDFGQSTETEENRGTSAPKFGG